MLEFISSFTNTFDRTFWHLLIYYVLNKNIFFETTTLEMYGPVSKYEWKGFIDGTENANRPLLPAKGFQTRHSFSPTGSAIFTTATLHARSVTPIQTSKGFVPRYREVRSGTPFCCSQAFTATYMLQSSCTTRVTWFANSNVIKTQMNLIVDTLFIYINVFFRDLQWKGESHTIYNLSHGL